MAKKKFFIAGTDTDAGKTRVACGLLEKARQSGLQTAAIKPVAAGCEKTDAGLRNDDALALQDAMTLQLPYAQVNPVALEEAIAPHIAAMHENKSLSVNRLAGFCNGILMQSCDWVVIEGAGGWRVPLNPRETLANLAVELNLPVILVVGMKLGCINHALLSVEAIERDGLKVAGWVANRIDPAMSCYEENIMTLRTLIGAPCLGEVPFLEVPSKENIAKYLDLESL
ncbi:dethiobiotin synthase [Pseudomaricurvus alkylphenolicus]|jgi:dethiobiotin synthetase|uniref:dethiobiotin synthase n=1 Tax=Pseudomaricurvus alkylphenolicus TaxID=1306991 RepID=UPI00141E2FB4|nr:dethiobiotin synthase [Pseudomaricurvus alkylphenolicus]NIB39248.1 dethiobiotin synthase [Pseudomaricurvus alkylphenolicus]